MSKEEWVIAFCIVAMVVWVGWANTAGNDPEYNRPKYEAWLVAHPTFTNLTLVQWNELRKAKLLLGQVDNSAAETAAIMSSVAAGAALAK